MAITNGKKPTIRELLRKRRLGVASKYPAVISARDEEYAYGITRRGEYPPGYIRVDTADKRAPHGVVYYDDPVLRIEISRHGLIDLTEEEAAHEFSAEERRNKMNEVIEWATSTSILDIPMTAFRNPDGGLLLLPSERPKWAEDPVFWDCLNQTVLDEDDLYEWPDLRTTRINHLPVDVEIQARRYHAISAQDGRLRVRSYAGASPLSRADILMLSLKANISAEFAHFGQGVVDDAVKLSFKLIEEIVADEQHPLRKFFSMANRQRGGGAEIRTDRLVSFRNTILPITLGIVPGGANAVSEWLRSEFVIGRGFNRVIYSKEGVGTRGFNPFGGNDAVFMRVMHQEAFSLASDVIDDVDDIVTRNVTEELQGKYLHPYMGLAEKEAEIQDLLLNPQPDKAPNVPNLSKDVKLYPHQAATVAAVAHMENAFIDADVGAGKTIMALVDMLNLMNTGKVKKPSMVMPNRLIPQQRKELLRFTEQKINVVVINNETCKFVKPDGSSGVHSIDDAPQDWSCVNENCPEFEKVLPEDTDLEECPSCGEELEGDGIEETDPRWAEWLTSFDYDVETFKMNEKSPRVKKNTDLIAGAPKNTVYLISYEWLAWYQYRANTVDSEGKEMTEVVISYGAEWLLSLGLDHVFFDESHWLSKDPSASKRVRGCRAFAQGCSYRRMATGTAMPNSAEDLYYQVSIIAPTYFGDLNSFQGEFGRVYSGGGRIRQFKSDAPKLMRKRMRENLGVSIRRENWLHILPKRHEEIHYVRLPPKQTLIYEAIRDAEINSLRKDAGMSAALDELSSQRDESDSPAKFQGLLGRLGRIDRAVNAPWLDKGLGPLLDILAAKGVDLDLSGLDTSVDKDGNPKNQSDFDEAQRRKKQAVEAFLGDERKSAKTDKVDAIIDAHLAKFPDAKVMVMGTNNASVAGVQEFSKYKTRSVFYNAPLKDELIRFEKDSNVKVLFGVDRSLLEGKNMQFCNCLIRIDLPWGPGDLEQNYGRIYRFGQKQEVFLHMVIAEGTTDMLRFSRMVSKKQQSTKYNSDFEEAGEHYVYDMNLDNMQDVVMRDSKIELPDGRFMGFEEAEQTYFNILEQEKERNVAVREMYGKDVTYEVASGNLMRGTKAAHTVQILKDDKDRAKAEREAWKERIGPEGKRGFGKRGLDEFGGLPEEAASPEAQALMQRAEVELRLVSMLDLDADDPDKDREIYVHVKIPEEGSKTLKGAGFYRWPTHRQYRLEVKNAAHAKNILKRMVQLLGGKWPKDAARILGDNYEYVNDIVREYMQRGKIPEIKTKKIPKREVEESKGSTIHELNLFMLNDKVYLMADEPEGGGKPLSVLRQLGFKRILPTYWYRIPSRGRMQTYINRLVQKYGLRITNWEDFAKRFKKAYRINLKNPLAAAEKALKEHEEATEKSNKEATRRRRKDRRKEYDEALREDDAKKAKKKKGKK